VRQRLRAEQKIRRRVVCFTAARLTGIRGFAYQLEAIATEKKGALKNLCFVWAARRPAQRYRQHVAELQVGEHVRLLGHRWDVADWYEQPIFFVLPSDSKHAALHHGGDGQGQFRSWQPRERHAGGTGDTGKLLPPGEKIPGSCTGLVETIESWPRIPPLRASRAARP